MNDEGKQHTQTGYSSGPQAKLRLSTREARDEMTHTNLIASHRLIRSPPAPRAPPHLSRQITSVFVSARIASRLSEPSATAPSGAPDLEVRAWIQWRTAPRVRQPHAVMVRSSWNLQAVCLPRRGCLIGVGRTPQRRCGLTPQEREFERTAGNVVPSGSGSTEQLQSHGTAAGSRRRLQSQSPPNGPRLCGCARPARSL